MTELDYTIIALAKKGVLAGDICRRLNITREQYRERMEIIKSILNVYKESTVDLSVMPQTKVM